MTGKLLMHLYVKYCSIRDGEIRNGIGGIAAEGDKSTNHPVSKYGTFSTGS